MKLFKILSLTLLAATTTFAMDDFLSLTGQQVHRVQTSRQAEYPKPLKDLKSQVMKITKTLVEENEGLRKKLGVSIPSHRMQHLLSQEASLPEDSLGSSAVEFVQAIFADLKRNLLMILSDLRQENALLKHLLTQKEESIEIEFSDGKKATYRKGGGLAFKGPVCITGNFQMSQSEIQYGGVRINLTLPLTNIVQELQSTPSVKRAVLQDIFLTPDQAFQREVATFNKAQSAQLSQQQYIDLLRNFYVRAQQYQKLGSKQARENFPVLQSILGTSLANQANDETNEKAIPLLREATNLLTQSARVGNVQAVRNLPNCNFLLGIALANLADAEEDNLRIIKLLGESLRFLETAVKLGKDDPDNQLPLIKRLLAQNVYQSIFPQSRSIESLGINDIAALNGCRDMLLSGDKISHLALILLSKINSVLRASQSQQSSAPTPNLQSYQLQGVPVRPFIEVPLELAEAINNVNTGRNSIGTLCDLLEGNEAYRKEKYIPAYLKLLSDPRIDSFLKMNIVYCYPHPELICPFVLANDHLVVWKYFNVLLENECFMRENGLSFFSELFNKEPLVNKNNLNAYRIDILYVIFQKNSFPLEGIVTLICAAVKNNDTHIPYMNNVFSLLVNKPEYKANIHGLRIFTDARINTRFDSYESYLLQALNLKK